jgi:hypothetical protein
MLRDANGSAEVRATFGRIDVSGVRKGVRIIGGNGNAIVADITGDAYVKTTFGQVQADRISGVLTVENSNGAVKASGIKGSASVRTSFSSVILDGIGGSVQVDNQNGAVEVSGLSARPSGSQGCNSIALKTSFSPIRVYVPEDGGYSVTARTSFGRINSELPLTVSGIVGADSLSGKIGSGECELRLTNSNGSIELLKGIKRK